MVAFLQRHVGPLFSRDTIAAAQAWFYQCRLPAIQHCTADHPMPWGARRRDWQHADFEEMFPVLAFGPDGRPQSMLVRCTHCGDSWITQR